ncbi:MAG TPA: response regulator [Steroidobacteraceae bacterium]|jgi:PAS domain S-box-containing protein
MPKPEASAVRSDDLPPRARLLIVDDEPAQMRALCDTLEREGYGIQGFSSAEQALAALRSGEFELLITDLMLPEMDGIALSKAAQEIDPTLPAIVMTGHGTINTAVRAMQGGVFDYILKPFSLSSILPVIERALDTRRLRRENAAMHLREQQRVEELAAAYRDLEEQVNLRSGQLQSVQRNLTTILDALPSIIGYWDKDLIKRIANRAYCEPVILDAVSPQGGQTRSLLGDILFEQGRTLVEAALCGQTATYERTLPGRDGGDATHFLVHLIPDIEAGDVVGLYLLAHDITEVTESKHKLAILVRENEGLLNTLHQHALVSVADRDGRITDVNTAFCTISGYTRDELLGNDHRIVSSGTHSREFWRGLWQHLNNGRPWRGEICNRARNGDVYWMDSIIAPFLGEDGRIEKYISIRFDITAHKKAERRMIESETFLQRVEQVSGVGGFMIDLSSGAQRWTHQCYRVHDLEDGCVPTMELLDTFLSAESRERCHDSARAAHETGKGYDIEMPIVTATGRSIWIRAAGEVERDNGVPARVVGAIQDITERRLMDQQLREATAVAERANKAKSEFLANMSHEIRTPLNAVIGLGYLLEQTTLNEDQHQFLTKIQFAGRSLLSVVNNVLDLSKIEAGEMALEDEPFDLLDLVQDIGQMLALQATTKGIELAVVPASTLPRMVKGDGLRLRQILTNLLNNSIKFTEAGHVELKVFCTEQGFERIRVRCEVTDTGIGIEPAALERLFTPFTQADASTTRRFGGTGLGLSIARRFVELMGGEIGVTSSLKVGSTFWIEIPFRIAHGVAGTLGGNRALGLQVLIAGPHGDAPQGLSGMVRALGWSPQTVRTSEQLLELMSSGQPNTLPDVLILDLERHQHDTGAHQLIARLERECTYGTLPPVIVVADTAQSYMVQVASMRATDALLVRPVTSSSLFNAINAAVWRRYDGRERLLQTTNFDDRHAQWLANVRVLVVDDSDINLEVARRILEKQGAVVACCSDGAAAVDYVRAHGQQLDVVLMDVQMPILDGNAAARQIRQEANLKMLPIVALTAGALVGERQRSLESGMNDFISKPFDPQTLIRKVRYLVEQARGEPIAMVILDSKPAQRTASGPIMPSIDAGVVQQMFGDDLPLFESLLVRLLRDYADLALPMLVVPDDDTARNELKLRTHKLKGSAGMIGATNVARLAGAAENALQQARPVDGILSKLAAALITLREEAQHLLERQPGRTVKTGATRKDHPNIDNADLEELCTLVEDQNLAALDKFAALSPLLIEVLDAACYDQLSDALGNLDFRLGTELLRGVLAICNNRREFSVG